MNERRRFIRQFSIGSLAALSFPALAETVTGIPLPSFSNDEAYWEQVKRQFAVPGNLTMMNAANLCPSPYPVTDRVVEFSKALARDVSFQFRSVFPELRTNSLTALAEMVGAKPEEVGITRNTSEANCIVIHGIDLKAGDEIIIWDQNHPSNEAVWINRAKRYGFTVKKISVPATPSSSDELVTPFISAITSKTKLIAFSHISNVSGIALPAEKICAIANSKGIMTLVDGAQSLGMTMLNVHNLGCTFFTASTHKWLLGPFENGILYVREDTIPKVWPNIIGAGWRESTTVDAKLCTVGQRNDATTAAIPETVIFHNSVGIRNIEQRVVELCTYLKNQIKEKLPQASFVTPLPAMLSGGIVIINLPGKDPREIANKLYTEYGVAAAATGGIRFSPHIYNTLKDIDHVVVALQKLSQ